jgi:hypothetical protein
MIPSRGSYKLQWMMFDIKVHFEKNTKSVSPLNIILFPW